MSTVSPEEISRRRKLVEDLGEFIKTSEETLKRVAGGVGWDFNQDPPSLLTVTCPLDKGHLVPKESLGKHLEQCSWKREGYNDKDVPLPSAGLFNSQTPGFQSITIDGALQVALLSHQRGSEDSADLHLVPKTANRIQSQFSREERLILYDYAVEKTAAAAAEEKRLLFEELSSISNSDKTKPESKDIMEKLAAERDARRRRATYKGKKVHTNRKSQTEIMKEVIDSQMQILFDVSDSKGEPSCDTRDEVEEENETVQSNNDDSTSRPERPERGFHRRYDNIRDSNRKRSTSRDHHRHRDRWSDSRRDHYQRERY